MTASVWHVLGVVAVVVVVGVAIVLGLLSVLGGGGDDSWGNPGL